MDNRQSIGYMLLACKKAGIDRTTARKIASEMLDLFDLRTEEEAEEDGFRWLDEMTDRF